MTLKQKWIWVIKQYLINIKAQKYKTYNRLKRNAQMQTSSSSSPLLNKLSSIGIQIQNTKIAESSKINTPLQMRLRESSNADLTRSPLAAKLQKASDSMSTPKQTSTPSKIQGKLEAVTKQVEIKTPKPAKSLGSILEAQKENIENSSPQSDTSYTTDIPEDWDLRESDASSSDSGSSDFL